MSVFSVRNVLPVVTAVVATLFLATAVPHDLVPGPAVAVLASPSLARAEVQRCVADGRDADACLDEAEGKALVERAEWLARPEVASRRASR
ncbi:MAG: hypothetical protein M3N82_18655 [Pseudomonadota bacterium]|nr:hypothetical protein [Pseudomonadota bacterium]